MMCVFDENKIEKVVCEHIYTLSRIKIPVWNYVNNVNAM